MANAIQTVMESKGAPTLKAIAKVFDIQAVRLYSVAKQPKAGEVYDAKVYNWDAIEKFVIRRLEPAKGLYTIEDVIDRALLIDVELQAQDGRHSRATGTNKKVEVDGKLIPIRKFKNFEAESNMLICLKKDKAVYKIVYQTLSHTVLVPVSDSIGTIASQDVKVISNGMLNFKGVGPATIEEGITKRFDGTYAVPVTTKETDAAE